MSLITTKADRELRIITVGEIRARRGDKPVLEGYAAKFNIRSHDFGGWAETIRPGAFTRTIADDDVVMHYDHGIGGGMAVFGRTGSKTLRLSQDAIGLRFEADLPNTTAGKDLLELVDRGDIAEMSFAFRARQPGGDEWHQEGVMSIRTLIDVKLFDIAPVVHGQYPQTEIALRSLDAWRKVAAHQGPDAMRRARLRLAEAEH
jgi:HK97 family phage prohead protease